MENKLSPLECTLRGEYRVFDVKCQETKVWLGIPHYSMKVDVKEFKGTAVGELYNQVPLDIYHKKPAYTKIRMIEVAVSVHTTFDEPVGFWLTDGRLVAPSPSYFGTGLIDDVYYGNQSEIEKKGRELNWIEDGPNTYKPVSLPKHLEK